VDLRRERVVLETDRYRVEADMTLPSSGHRSRLSDHVNRPDLEFLTLQDATLTRLGGGESWTSALLLLATRHVRLIVPAADDAE
jgi:hypothetical protein